MEFKNDTMDVEAMELTPCSIIHERERELWFVAIGDQLISEHKTRADAVKRINRTDWIGVTTLVLRMLEHQKGGVKEDGREPI